MSSVLALYTANAREFLRDRMAALFTFIIPIAFAAFFGSMFGGGDAYRISLGVVVEDVGIAGQQLVSSLTSPEAQKMLNVEVGSRDDMLASLEEGEIHIVLLLPANLTQMIAENKTTEVEIYFDSARQSSAGIGLGMVRTLLAETNLNLKGLEPLLVPQIKSIQSSTMQPVDFFVPSTLAMAILWLGLFGTTMPLVEQREQHVLRRLSICPVPRLNLLAGQVLWRLTVGLTQAAAFVLVGITVLGLQFRGDWLLFALAAALGAGTFISMGYMLAGFSRTTESATALTQVVNFPMMFLSGIFFETQALPSFLRPVANIMPPTYLADAFRQTISGYPPLYPLWLDFAVLGAWLVVFIGIGLRTFRWERS